MGSWHDQEALVVPGFGGESASAASLLRDLATRACHRASVSTAEDFYDALGNVAVHALQNGHLGRPAADAPSAGTILAAGAACLNVFTRHNLTG
jgi:hypothetical protein